MSHPIEGIMETALHNIKAMVDVDTIVGDPVETADGTVVIPLSKVSFGFVAGGSDIGGSKDEGQIKFGGGSGGGVTISPVAFMAVGKEQIKLIPVSSETTLVDKVLDAVPGFIEKINSKLGKKKGDKKAKDEAVAVAEAE